jgi:hypothetical protein
LINKYGPPKVILSDRGASFTSLLFSNLAELLGYQHNFSSSRSPQTQGKVEVSNKSYMTLFTHAKLQNPKLSSQTIHDDVISCINSLPHTRLGVSSFYIFHGWDKSSNFEISLKNIESSSPENYQFLSDFVRKSGNRLSLTNRARALVNAKTKMLHDKNIKQYKNLIPGDVVLLETPAHNLSSGTSRKMKVRRAGPFIVKTILGGAAYLTDIRGKDLRDLFSLRRLSKIEGYDGSFAPDLSDFSQPNNLGDIGITLENHRVASSTECTHL